MSAILVETLEEFNNVLEQDKNIPVCLNVFNFVKSYLAVYDIGHSFIHEGNNSQYYLLTITPDAKHIMGKMKIEGYTTGLNFDLNPNNGFLYYIKYYDTPEVPTSFSYNSFGSLVMIQYKNKKGKTIRTIEAISDKSIESILDVTENFKPCKILRDEHKNILNIIYHINGNHIEYDKIREYITTLDPIDEVCSDDINLTNPYSFLTAVEMGLLEMVFI